VRFVLGFRISKEGSLCKLLLPERPWEKVAVDLFEWKGGHYLVTINYSRFLEIKKLNGLGTKQVIAALQPMFACHGLPNDLVSDIGPQFPCSEFARWTSKYGIKHTTTSLPR
jgi:hypothetical protein